MHFPQIVAYEDKACPTCPCGEMEYRLYFGDRRVANAKQHIYRHLESVYHTAVKNKDEADFHIKDSGPFDCPLCSASLDLKKGDLGLLSEGDPSVVSCSNGHDFDAYYKDKNVFLFVDNSDGPYTA